MIRPLLASVAAIATIGLTAMPADAQRAPRGGNEEAAPAEGRQFSSANGAIVSEAQTFLQAENWSAALAKLDEALRGDLNPYERSIINQMRGTSYYELGQIGQAVRAFNDSINAGGLTATEADQLKVNIAQLQIADGQYAQGAQALENYINQGGQRKPQYVEMLTQAWVGAENYSRALPWAEEWFRSANPKERKHFDLLNFLYNNLNMPGKQSEIVLQMINRFPNDKALWGQWISMLANGGREQDALEVTKMLYLSGVTSDENEILKLVQYLSFYDQPYQAAEILNQEMNAGRVAKTGPRLIQLSDLYRQSREYKKAIPFLREAAATTGQSKTYAALGEALYNEGNCSAAEEAFRESISRGGSAGKAWMQIGSCRYEVAQEAPRLQCDLTPEQIAASPRVKGRNNAIAAFRQVPGSSREASAANKWISFIRSEGESFDARCEFEADLVRQQCFFELERAYKAEPLTGRFEVQNEECLTFKEDYDSKFRRVVSNDAG